MHQHIDSVKRAEVAELPLKLNLQLFAETEPVIGDGGGDDPLPENPDDAGELEPEQPEKTDNPEVVEPDKGKPVQDDETNAKFAQMRRDKEAAEQRAKAADEWAKQTYGHLGINTFAEYQTALAEQQKRDEYAEKGIDYDEVRKLMKDELNQHPDVVKAREIEQKSAVNAEIRDLKAAYPDLDVSEVADMADLLPSLEKLPGWEQMKSRIQRGYSLVDAFELANRESIRQKEQAAARQAALNNMSGKSHIKPNGGEGDVDAVTVPTDVMNQYRSMFAKELRTGKMTEADFVKHYKRSLAN